MSMNHCNLDRPWSIIPSALRPHLRHGLRRKCRRRGDRGPGDRLIGGGRRGGARSSLGRAGRRVKGAENTTARRSGGKRFYPDQDAKSPSGSAQGDETTHRDRGGPSMISASLLDYARGKTESAVVIDSPHFRPSFLFCSKSETASRNRRSRVSSFLACMIHPR